MKTIFKSLTILCMVMFLHTPSHAADPVYTGLFSKKAVGGYDTVTYFSGDAPVKGLEQFKTKWRGANWYFSTQENLDAFKAEPAKYAPQYGGYCAWAVAAKKDLVKGDPQVYSLHNNKLYLNYDPSIHKKWDAQKEQFILQADTTFPTLVTQ